MATKTAKAPARKPRTETFSAEEKAAMRAAAKEAKKGKNNGEADLREAIGKLTGTDKELAEKLDAIVRANAPSLAGKTWYGMPAWAGADGKAVCFFTPAQKFKERYASFGFNPGANLDDGNLWVTSFAVLKIGAAEEKQLAAIVKRAAG